MNWQRGRSLLEANVHKGGNDESHSPVAAADVI